MQKPLGPLEAQFLAYAQLRRLHVVRPGELTGPLRLTVVRERRLLSRLSRSGMIVRVRRGLYLVPPRLPLGGRWSPDEALAINTLMAECQGRYQICGPNAFNRYGYDGQIPGRVYLYNNRISGEQQIGAVALTLIKVADDRLGATDEVRTRDGPTLVYSSRARTLVDAVYDWSRFDSLPRAYDWIRCDLAAGRLTAAELVRVATQFGNQNTLRRIGVLLEQNAVPERLLGQLQRALNRSASIVSLIPNAARRGPISKRWGVVLNAA